MFAIRAATAGDVPLLLRFFRELAEFERYPDAVVINEETLITDGFGAQPKFRSLIAEWDGQAIGYALFFNFYSSWKGSGIFLEDLFVREAFRGRGIGRALLSEVARIARQEGSFGIRWEVLDWNEPAIQFYKSLAGLPKERFVLAHQEMSASLRGAAGATSLALVLDLPHPSIFCGKCDRREAFSPIWYVDVSKDISTAVAVGVSKRVVLPDAFQSCGPPCWRTIASAWVAN